MKTLDIGARIALKNILFLTDLSESSEGALPFALAIAREYGAKIHALHVLNLDPLVCVAPDAITAAIEAQEQKAQMDMQVLGAQLDGVPHEVTFVRGNNVWEHVEQAIGECNADLIVVGTRGRTGAEMLLLGSVAEEIFRRSDVPVLTIGPWARSGMHSGAHFHSVLFATDFTPESLAAAPYAVSMAQENEARLTLVYVASKPNPHEESHMVISEAGVSHELGNIVPHDAELWCRPKTIVRHGDPAEQILLVAKENDADCIVLGVRRTGHHLRAATLVGRTVAHKIVAHANCPVLTVRG